METIIDALLNNTPAFILLAYFVYKDNKSNDTITKALTRIDMQLEKLCKAMSRKDSDKT